MHSLSIHHRFMAAVSAAVVVAGMTGCKCGREPTDEERLLKRIDTTPVHVYVAAKVALARAGEDPEIKEARDTLLEVIEQASHSETDAKSVVRLGKALWKLRATGSEIAKSGKEDEMTSVLPLLLVRAGVSEEAALRIDPNTEHGLFLVAMTALKAHPKSPVPVPAELVLYEAWKTDPDTVQIPGASPVLHGLKAWSYGINDLCNLAEREAAAAEEGPGPLGAAPLLRDVLEVALEAQTKAFPAARALGHGGVTICHLSRGDDKKARPSLKLTLDNLEKTGVAPEELAELRIVHDCGGDDAEVKDGLKKLAVLEKNAPKRTPELESLRAYCEASDETSTELARKLSLTSKLLSLGVRIAQKSAATRSAANSPAFKAANGFARACGGAADGIDVVSGGIDSVKGSAKRLLNSFSENGAGRSGE